MKTMTVGEFKTHFSDVLEAVRRGETVIVEFGRDRRKVAALVPYSNLKQSPRRRLGVLKGEATATFAADFSVDDETLLGA